MPTFWSLPEIPRVLPFAVFLILTSFQGKYFAGSEYWIYGLKTIVATGLIWHFKSRLSELKWAISVPAVVTGILIALLWLGLDSRIPSLGQIYDFLNQQITGTLPVPEKPEAPWNPLVFFKDTPSLAWTFLALRVLGRSLIVPVVEEVFYRSFFYRYIVNPDFSSVAHRVWHLRAFILTSLAFGLSHPGQWIPAILCGTAYQALVIRQDRMGDAMVAHGVTNAVISAYAIYTGQWQFT